MEDQSYETAMGFSTLPNWMGNDVTLPNWMGNGVTLPNWMVNDVTLPNWMVNDVTLPNWMGNDVYGLVGNHYASELSLMPPGSSGIHQEPVWNTQSQWMMHNQQAPPNYFQFIGESSCPGILNDTPPCSFPVETSSLGLLNPYQVQYTVPHEEGNMMTNYSNMEPQLSIKRKNLNEDGGSALQAYARSDSTASKRVSDVQRKKQREKRYAADRNRKVRISKSLDALQELMPHLKEDCKEVFLDKVIGHVQHLQNQVKDLSQSRLGGESTSDTFMFLKGQEHYPAKKPMHNKPLEDMIEQLFKFDPVAATQLLHSKGLLVLPVTLAEGLREPVEVLNTQGKVDSDLQGDAE